jgi:hypothetical protein
VSVLHSTIVGLIVSFAVSVVLSSYLLYFRENRFLDDLLSFLLVDDRLKVGLVQLVWSPLRFILIGGLVIFLGLLLGAALIMGFRLILKTRVFAYHAYTIMMWSVSPLVVLIPVGMILFRVMESPAYILPSVILFVVLAVWAGLRVLKGISIVFDVPRGRVYLLAAGIAVIVGAALYLYYDLAHSAPTYFAFIIHTLSVGG